jgi:hypothetical protein
MQYFSGLILDSHSIYNLGEVSYRYSAVLIVNSLFLSFIA